MLSKMPPSENRYRDLLDSLDNVVFEIDDCGVLVYLNSAWTELLGFTVAESLGLPLEHFAFPYFPDGDANFLSGGDRELIRHKSIRHKVICLCDRNQAPLWFELSASFGTDRRVTGLLIPIADLEQELCNCLVQELQTSKDLLQTALHEKEILLKEIHHRIKNNLLVVSNLLEWQSDYVDDPIYIKMIGETQNRIHSMALIHEKLYQSKNLAKVDLSEYLKVLVNQLLFSWNLNPGKIQLTYDLDPVWLNIETVTPCGLIVNELVSNACKHAFPNNRSGNLWLRVKGNAERAIVTIRDDGIGLPAGFDIGRAESMGLQLVRLLTKQLEGQLHIRLDGGTTFELTFSEL